MSAPRHVVVVLGTDHHPFARLVEWADGLHGRDGVTVTVQHGFSRAPAAADGFDFTGPQALHDLMATADVVVTHGGPGTIMAARNAGHRPLVVPRDPARGEHVDRHQLAFAEWAGRRGLGLVQPSTDALTEAVARGSTRGEALGSGAETRRTAARLEQLLADLDSGAPRVLPGAPRVVLVSGVSPEEVPGVAALLPEEPAVLVTGRLGDLLTTAPESLRCSCGRTLASCPWWGDHVPGTRQLPARRRSRRRRAAALARLYAELAATTGAATVVEIGADARLAPLVEADPSLDVVAVAAERLMSLAPAERRRLLNSDDTGTGTPTGVERHLVVGHRSPTEGRR